MSATAFIEGDEMVDLTKAKRAADQEKVLNSHGIFYIKRRDNTLVTTIHHVNHPIGLRTKEDSQEPDFEFLND